MTTTKIITPSGLSHSCRPLRLSGTVDRRTMGAFSLWGPVTHLCPAQSQPHPQAVLIATLPPPQLPCTFLCVQNTVRASLWMVVFPHFYSFLVLSCPITVTVMRASPMSQGCLLKMTVGGATAMMSQKTQNGRKTAAFTSQAEQQMHKIFELRQTFCVVMLHLAQASFTLASLWPDLLRLYNQGAWPNHGPISGPNNPQVCGVCTTVLVLLNESELPRSGCFWQNTPPPHAPHQEPARGNLPRSVID